MIPGPIVSRLQQLLGPDHVRADEEARHTYGADRKLSHPADLVVLPGSTREVAAVAAACHGERIPLVVRGGGTGYTGGSVPVRGGVVMALERMNRILEIDEANLLAVVEPNVVTGVLQQAVEARGLFYPPDPASLNESVIGGNIAAGAGGPRAFKYGTTRQWVLGLEVVLPTGETIRTGSKAVKHAVGYDLTHLIVGSEGTLAIVTQAVLRLIPKPPVQVTLRATFSSVASAVAAVDALLRARVVPATLELVDDRSLEAVSAHLGQRLAPEGTAAVLILEVDGAPAAASDDARRVEEACRAAGATEVLRAAGEAERAALWAIRRELSPALKALSSEKINHDLVVPRGRVPQLFDLVEQVRRRFALRIACFGHAGDGNIHVNILVSPGNGDERRRAHAAERALFEGAIALEGSISGEHGVGVVKAPYLALALSPEEIALMRGIKRVFDPNGILNPGKIFAD